MIDASSDLGGRDPIGEEQDTQARVNSQAAASNPVHARVGDVVLRAARDGVRHGMRPDDIIREIVTDHQVRLSLGELRLLLASRPIAQSGK
jgi:hypothetical protein